MKRIAKWGTILGASDIKYTPRASNKGLVLAGLVAQKEYVDILEPFDAVKQNISQTGSLDLLLREDQRVLATFFDDCATNGIEHMVMIPIVPTLLAYLKLMVECCRRFR